MRLMMDNSAGTHLFWYVARGSGFVAYTLLLLSVTLGVALSRRWHAPAWPRLVVDGMHRWLTITFYLFTLVHVVTMLLDPFAKFSVADVLVPFASSYRTFWLSLGIIAAELGVAVGASVWVRRWIGYRTWHVLHGLSYPIFVMSLLHGLLTGTDTHALWAAAIYGGSIALLVGVTGWRIAGPSWADGSLTRLARPRDDRGRESSGATPAWVRAGREIDRG
jgi:predicted ferric reductase